MIITLQDAQQIDPKITQARLDAYEAAIRQLTNNNFQVRAARSAGLTFAGDLVTFDPITPPPREEITTLLNSVKVGDTVQISNADVNDGLYTVQDITDDSITLDRAVRRDGYFQKGFATLVVYPPDIAEGVRKLIAYDMRMLHKMGVKSESISRMRLDYYDVNAGNILNGYPAILMNFIHKYIKIKWGG